MFVFCATLHNATKKKNVFKNKWQEKTETYHKRVQINSAFPKHSVENTYVQLKHVHIHISMPSCSKLMLIYFFFPCCCGYVSTLLWICFHPVVDMGILFVPLKMKRKGVVPKLVVQLLRRMANNE